MAKEGYTYNTVFIKKDGVLVYKNPGGEEAFTRFKTSLEEGSVVQVFFDANPDDGTLAQLAKIKVCIRRIAAEMGATFEDTQKEVKVRSGLIVENAVEGQVDITYRSFADCSKEELSTAIATIIQIGEFINLDLR